MSATLPEWADEWGPTGVKCCGQRTVLVRSWGEDPIVCQVTGWGIDECATHRSATRRPPSPQVEGN